MCVPDFGKLRLIRRCSLNDEFSRSRGKVALNHLKCFDVEDRVELPINHMEVGWRMITEEELDDDSVETCDLGHILLLFVCTNVDHQQPA